MEFSWAHALIFVVLAAGHAALSIGLVNRLHALPLTHTVLHHLRQVHDLLLFGLPIAFVWLAGFRGPRLFLGGSWGALPLPILAYLALCGLFGLGLPAWLWHRSRKRPPAMQLSNHSERIDISRRLGFRPVGTGPYSFMTNWPGNEFLQVEVSDKQYRLPRLPQEWDGLSILHLTDWHLIGTVDRPYFEELVEIARTRPVDLVVFTGDLLDRKDLLAWLPPTLGRLSAPLGCWYVLGNHDWYLHDTDDIRNELAQLGWRGLAGQCQVAEHLGKKLVLCGSEHPWMGKHPDLADAPPDAFRVFLSHTPDNLPWARQNQIDLMLAGHNHGGQVRLPGIGPVYSPSAFGTRYAAGAFWEAPTLLYVSRGIGGRQPWRWRCPPELTRLILRPAFQG